MGNLLRLSISEINWNDVAIVPVCLPKPFVQLCLSLTLDVPYFSAFWYGEGLPGDMVQVINEGILAMHSTDYCELIQDIIDRIEELESMNVNVCCCGCGCGSGSGNGCNVPGSGEDIAQLPVPTDDPNPQSSEVCNVVNLAYDTWVRFINEVLLELTTSGSLDNVLELILASYAGGIISFSIALAYTLIAFLAGNTIETVASGAISLLQSSRDELICIWYTSPNAIAAKEGTSELLLASGTPFLVRMLLWYMIQAADWNALYNGSIDATEYAGSVCDCGGVVPLGCTGTGGDIYPLAPEGWCYQSIESISFVGQVGFHGQNYQILGKDVRIYGSDHPGNIDLGFYFDLGSRPVGSGALVCVLEKNGGSAVGRWGNEGATPTPLIPSGTIVPQDSWKTIGYVSSIQDMVDHRSNFDLYISAHPYGSGGTYVFLGPNISLSLEGEPYDVTFKHFAWLVPVV